MATNYGANEMRVTVKLFASFRKKWFNETVRECPPEATVYDVATEIGILAQEVGIVLVDGRHASLDHVLRDGDVVFLMPLIGGG